MKVLLRVLLPVLASVVTHLPTVQAQQRQITTTITSLGDAVTYSTATETYVIGYTVTIENLGNNTVNNVRFEGKTSVPGLVAGYKGSDGITCDPVSNPDRTNIDMNVTCRLGTAVAGYSKTFSIFFYSPVAPVDNEFRTVTFTGTTIFAEGTTDNPNNPPANDTRIDTISTVQLGTTSPEEVKSALTPDGGTFFTDPVDAFFSQVTVPPQQKSSSVTLKEDPSDDATTCSSLKNFVTCYKSEITVPEVVFSAESGRFLAFGLRVSGANIRKGSKIGKVKIRYQSPDEYGVPAIGPIELQFCSKDGSGNPMPNTAMGSMYVPCIAYANDFTRKGSVGFDGYDFVIYNLKNGRFDLF